MRPEVHFQLVVLGKALGAMRAGVGFLARVGSFVDPELALMTVALSAQVAGIRSLARVGALMVLQQVSSAKTLATITTDVSSLRAVSPHVYVK